MSLCEVLGQLHVLHVELWIQGDALVLVLRALLLSLVFVHVYGDGEAFPESWVADACHCSFIVSRVLCGIVLRLNVRRLVVVIW